jgi:hypothetical protein
LITYYAPTLYAGIGLGKYTLLTLCILPHSLHIHLTFYILTLLSLSLGQNNYPKLLAACNGTEYLMASFIPIFIVEKVGRRPLMLFGSVGMALSMAALAISNYYVTLDPDNINSKAGIAQAVFLFVFNSFFAVGW